jgi:hypothetical protein
MEERELTEDELGLIACAIRYGPFPPRPEYLADCHRLFERGWLERTVSDDAVLFGLSARGVTALELGVPVGAATAAMS